MEQKRYVVKGYSSSNNKETWFVNKWGLREATAKDNCKFTKEFAEELKQYLENKNCFFEECFFKYQIEELQA